jgi:putative ABC transport system substrate-binding protein
MQFDQLKRREFISLIGGATAAWPLAGRAQQTQKSYRVAYLALAGDQDAVIVKHRLADLGYAEGKNLIFDFRSAEGHQERLPQLAADLVKTNPDVIVAGFGTATAKAAQSATASIPVVFTSVGDPIGSGIVKSLNRPGANITGLHAQAAEIVGKRLQILEELSPGVRIVAVLLEPDDAIYDRGAPRVEERRRRARGPSRNLRGANGRSTRDQCRGCSQGRRDRPHDVGNSLAA